MNRALGRIVGAAILTAAALALAGCSWDYLYPGSSFERDEKWKRNWTEGDKATKEMPLYLNQGQMGVNDDWSQLFPEGDQ